MYLTIVTVIKTLASHCFSQWHFYSRLLKKRW